MGGPRKRHLQSFMSPRSALALCSLQAKLLQIPYIYCSRENPNRHALIAALNSCSALRAPGVPLRAAWTQRRQGMSGRNGSGWGAAGSSSGGGGDAGGGSSGPSRGRRLSIGSAMAGRAQSYPGPDDDAGLLNKLLKRRSSGAMQLQQVRAAPAAPFSLPAPPARLPSRLGTTCQPALRSHPSTALQQPLSSAQLRRNRDKLVALLEEGQYALLNGGGGDGPSPQPSPVTAPGLAGDDELLPAAVEEVPPAYTGRIAIHATAARWAVQPPLLPPHLCHCCRRLARPPSVRT